MRLFGYVLLIFGFAWFCYLPVVLSSSVRQLGDEQGQKIPVKESYSREELGLAVGNSLVAFYDQWPSILPGALPMLAGGIILDLANRRKRV